MIKLVIGLTGGIGSGKTTVASLFHQQGATVIDSDQIAKELSYPGQMGYQAILEHFGKEILKKNSNQIDRKKLRNIIFNDYQAKKWLEETLHPLIIEEIQSKIKQSDFSYCIIVIPLLLETSIKINFLDRICVVDTTEELQKKWASQRDHVSPDEIAQVMKSQASRAQRLAIANDIILNTNGLAALETQVKKLHLQYLQMSLS
jgi:dephospho-CoA kinase